MTTSLQLHGTQCKLKDKTTNPIATATVENLQVFGDPVFGPAGKTKQAKQGNTHFPHTPFSERINFLGALERWRGRWPTKVCIAKAPWMEHLIHIP